MHRYLLLSAAILVVWCLHAAAVSARHHDGLTIERTKVTTIVEKEYAAYYAQQPANPGTLLTVSHNDYTPQYNMKT